MALLLIFAFASGFVTGLTPCVLPVLPIVLSSTVTGGRRRPLGVIVGLILSFTFFTLALTSLVRYFQLPGDLLRNIAIGVLVVFGLSLLIPRVNQVFERLFAKLNRLVPQRAQSGNGFWSGFLLGLSLGLLWAPCAGPILASVIALAATARVTLDAVLVTFAYACGSAFIFLIFAYGGKGIITRFRSLNSKTGVIQRVFGVVMLLAAIGLVFNIDRTFQTYTIQHLPSWALTPLASLETSGLVSGQLQGLSGSRNVVSSDMGFDSARLLSNYGDAPEFIQATKWLNVDHPLSMKELKGKVVLVDFWTYSCVNCIRTLPHIEELQRRYGDKGFTVIGVHSPEFAFERVEANVSKAIKDFGLTYPVVMDNDFGIWNAYENRYWPAHYLIDANGTIRFEHFGEGRYDDTERAIQLLLHERGTSVDYSINSDSTANHDVAVSPETYVGYGRADLSQYASNEDIVHDTDAVYSAKKQLSVNHYSLSGKWNVNREFAQAHVGSKLTYHFIGKEVNLVVSDGQADYRAALPSPRADFAQSAVDYDTEDKGGYCNDSVCVKGKQVLAAESDPKGLRVRVTLTGVKGKNNGRDVVNGIVTVTDAKLYNLVSLDTAQEGTVTLEFLDDGVRAFAYTFG